MKILIISLSILVLCFQVEAIGKKKTKADPKDAKIDSLTKVSQKTALQLDSVSKELTKYTEVYTSLKEKVFHYNFEPGRTSLLIDSLKTVRDSTAVLPSSLAKSNTSDSIRILLNENKMLKNRADSIQVAWGKYIADNTTEEIERAKAITGIKQLRELLNDKIISEAEYASLKKKYLDKL